MIPETRVAMIAPEPLISDKGFLRLHNRIAKDALEEEALNHWKRRIPGHFRATARAKYGYKERAPKYKAYKLRKWKSRTDLVKSGATRDAIIGNTPKIRMGGKAANPDGTVGGLRLSMEMTLPFGQAAQASVAANVRKGKRKAGAKTPTRPGVDIAEIKREIANATTDEAREIIAGFGKRYHKKLTSKLKTSPKFRKRIAFARLGDILGF